MDSPRPYKQFERRSVFAVAVSLLVGILIGVALDRAFLHLFSKCSAGSQSGSARAQLVGQWAGIPNGEGLEFKSDGTFTSTMVLLGMQGVEGSQSVLGQWRRLDDDSIEMNSFGQRGDRARVVIDRWGHVEVASGEWGRERVSPKVTGSDPGQTPNPWMALAVNNRTADGDRIL